MKQEEPVRHGDRGDTTRGLGRKAGIGVPLRLSVRLSGCEEFPSRARPRVQLTGAPNHLGIWLSRSV
jgi:hypothetical protein